MIKLKKKIKLNKLTRFKLKKVSKYKRKFSNKNLSINMINCSSKNDKKIFIIKETNSLDEKKIKKSKNNLNENFYKKSPNNLKKNFFKDECSTNLIKLIKILLRNSVLLKNSFIKSKNVTKIIGKKFSIKKYFISFLMIFLYFELLEAKINLINSNYENSIYKISDKIFFKKFEQANFNFSLENYLSIDKLNNNEINSTILILKQKWWLSFFPEKCLIQNITLGNFLIRVFGAFFCIFLIISTLIGNVLTITAVAKYKHMQTVTNKLLASLAVADITVALLVMPFSIIYDYLRYWPIGAAFCHFFISCDVMCCTASILHLCITALYRYFEFNRSLNYKTILTKKNLRLTIAGIWLISILISFLPIFSGIYYDGTVPEIFSMANFPECYLKVNKTYAIFSSMVSFYLPLPIMIFLYWKIYLIANKHRRQIEMNQPHLQLNNKNNRNNIVNNQNYTNYEPKTSTTIQTNSLPTEISIKLSIYQPFDYLIQNLSNCKCTCQCFNNLNNFILSTNKPNKSKIKLNEIDDQNLKLTNSLISLYDDVENVKSKSDKTNNLKNKIECSVKSENKIKNSKLVSNETEKNESSNRIFNHSSKYKSKQFGSARMNSSSFDEKENKKSDFTQMIPNVIESDEKKQEILTNRASIDLTNNFSLKSDKSDIEKAKKSQFLNKLNYADSYYSDFVVFSNQLNEYHQCCFYYYLQELANNLKTKIDQQQNVQKKQDLNSLNLATHIQDILSFFSTNALSVDCKTNKTNSSSMASNLNNTDEKLCLLNKTPNCENFLNCQDTSTIFNPNINLIDKNNSLSITNLSNLKTNNYLNVFQKLNQINQCLQNMNEEFIETPKNQNKNNEINNENKLSCNLMSDRKCSDTSTTSGPLKSCSSFASKSFCSYSNSSGSAHCFNNNLIQNYNKLPLFFNHNLTQENQTILTRNKKINESIKHEKHNQKRLKLFKDKMKEVKSIRTLGIVMGVFFICWFPFFLMYLLSAFYPDLSLSHEWKSSITWLGYLNSSLNPFIYTLLNKNFKNAFKKILNCAPKIIVQDASANYNQPNQNSVRKQFLNYSTQSFSGSVNIQNNSCPKESSNNLSLNSTADHKKKSLISYCES